MDTSVSPTLASAVLEGSPPSGSTPPEQGSRPVTFDAFYQLEFSRMVSLACTICGDYQQGEDVAQEAMTRTHRHWEKVRTYDRPGAWLRRVTINLALSRTQRLKRELKALGRFVGQLPSSDLVAGQLTSPPADAGPIEGFDDEVWNAVRRLPARQRAVVGLFYQEDLSTREIADTLGCSVSTTTSHLHQARTALAQQLNQVQETTKTQADKTPIDETMFDETTFDEARFGGDS